MNQAKLVPTHPAFEIFRLSLNLLKMLRYFNRLNPTCFVIDNNCNKNKFLNIFSSPDPPQICPGYGGELPHAGRGLHPDRAVATALRWGETAECPGLSSPGSRDSHSRGWDCQVPGVSWRIREAFYTKIRGDRSRGAISKTVFPANVSG